MAALFDSTAATLDFTCPFNASVGVSFLFCSFFSPLSSSSSSFSWQAQLICKIGILIERNCSGEENWILLFQKEGRGCKVGWKELGACSRRRQPQTWGLLQNASKEMGKFVFISSGKEDARCT